MHSTLSHLQVAVTVLLAILPFISATPPPTRTYPSPKGLRLRANPVQSQESSGTPGLPSPPGWESIGCYTDNPAQRALTSSGYSDLTSMTTELCTTICRNTGPHIYAGVENGTDCYCGNVLTPGTVPASPWDCTTPCVGNPKENCGGDNSLTLYSNGTAPPPQPTLVLDVPSADSWETGGCYSDNVDARTLTTQVFVDGGPYELTVDKCVDKCIENNFRGAGVELAQQCFCGNSTNGGKSIDMSHCVMACSGDSSQICGGTDALVLYYLDAA